MRTLQMFLILMLSLFIHDLSAQSVTEIKTRKMGIKPICTNLSGDTLYMGIQKQLYVWHVPTGRLIRKMNPKAGRIRSISNVNDKSTLVVAGSGFFGKGKVVFLNRQRLNQTDVIELDRRSLAVSVSPDNDRLAISSDRKIFVYTYGKKEPDTIIETGFHTLGLDFSENGRKLAYGGSNKRVILLDLESGTELGSIGHRNWVRKIVFNRTNTFLISAGDDRSVYFTDITNPDFSSKILTGHKNRIYDLLISPDNRYLISASTDQTYAVWDAENKQMLEQYRTKPASGISHITLAYECKQLILSTVVRKELPVIDISYLKIDPGSRIQRNSEDKDPPQIYVASPEKSDREKIITFEDPFPIKGTVLDEYGLRSVTLNGQEMPVRENGNFAQFLPLAFGDNPVTIEAMDVNGNISVKKFILTRKSMQGEDVARSETKNHLLVIGINEYENWPELNNAVNDAASVKEVLTSKYGFNDPQSTVLLNKDATRNNIYEALRSFIEKVGPNDNLLIYYAGHGYFDELLNEGYWVPVEAGMGQAAEYLPNTTILKIIGNIQSKHTFLVADACFSGSLFAERERGFTENVERYKSRWGLASGRLEEVSDGSGKHSPFASSFVSCLNQESQTEFTASEVVQYVKKSVAHVAKQTPRGSPLRNVGDEGGEFVFRRITLE